METVEKKKTRVLKTKLGLIKGDVMPNSTFTVVEINGKKYTLETLSSEDIKARRNPAYQYLV